MLRAKTLLAGVAVAGTVVTVFGLNADHEGFVPQSKGSPTPVLAELKREAGPAQVIAQLPKLAPVESASSTTTREIKPTQIAPAVHTKSEFGSADAATGGAAQPVVHTSIAPSVGDVDVGFARSGKTTGQPSITSTVANQTFAALPASETHSSSPAIGIPLPTRLPQGVRALRRKETARTASFGGAATDTLLFDPATSGIDDRATLRLQQRERALRARRKRQRIAVRKAKAQAPEPVFEEVAPQVKPRRHRKPFDNNRN